MLKGVQEFFEHMVVFEHLPSGIDLRVVVRKEVGLEEKSMNFPILLFHGWGTGLEGMLQIAFFLWMQNVSVILVSLPGYGNSELNNSNFPGSDIRAITEALKELNLKNFHLIGHSMGGKFGADFSIQNSEMVQSLTLINPAGFFEEKSLGLIAKFFWSRLQTYCTSTKMCIERKRLALREGLKRPQESYWKGDKRKLKRWREFQYCISPGLFEVLEKISAPRNIILSKGDTIFPFDKIDIEKLERLGCDHYVHLSFPHNPTILPWAEPLARICFNWIKKQE